MPFAPDGFSRHASAAAVGLRPEDQRVSLATLGQLSPVVTHRHIGTAAGESSLACNSSQAGARTSARWLVGRYLELGLYLPR